MQLLACFLSDCLCASTTIPLCLLHPHTDERLLKIPRLAIKSSLRCNFREPNSHIIYATSIADLVLGPTPHLLLVEHTIMDAIRR